MTNVFEERVRALESISLVDKRLEDLDPNPDIFRLFREYNKRFFKGMLCKCKVRLSWSDSMVERAGICIKGQNGIPVQIQLSRRLMRNECRHRLVELLLHYMIHAFIYLLNFQKEIHSHGPEFIKVMNDINTKTNTNITPFNDLCFDELI